ncbi:MAG: Lrp/AsnC family transcriptional regulator [Candidatus Bathyarchaeia archaeon]
MNPSEQSTDEHVLAALQDGLPLTSEPFHEAAKQLQMSEKELLKHVKRLKNSGIIRRFGAVINHRKAGILANALVVWNVPADRLKEVASALSRDKHVSHCYQRQTIPGRWNYNLFTMMHGFDRQSVEARAKRLSRSVKVEDYMLLFSAKEYKKTSTARIRLSRETPT